MSLRYRGAYLIVFFWMKFCAYLFQINETYTIICDAAPGSCSSSYSCCCRFKIFHNFFKIVMNLHFFNSCIHFITQKLWDRFDWNFKKINIALLFKLSKSKFKIVVLNIFEFFKQLSTYIFPANDCTSW